MGSWFETGAGANFAKTNPQCVGGIADTAWNFAKTIRATRIANSLFLKMS
jgi:hypothetical protein